MTPDYLLYPLLFNNATNVKTGYVILDTIIIVSLITILFFVEIHKLKKFVSNCFVYVFKEKKSNVTFSSKGKDRSIKYKAIMYHLSKSYNKTINSIEENTNYGWDKKDEFIEKSSFFEINQNDEFKIDENIFGLVSTETIDRKSIRDDYNEPKIKIHTLDIYSKNKDLNYINKWIEKKLQEYKIHLREKMNNKQMLLSISYNNEEKEIDIESTEWLSYISFDNSYFQNKEYILNKINFFLNNQKWYKDRGIPYNLGILLYGEPGGGKTRFIKQLINHTKRHGIDIKLNNYFDFKKLKTIIYNEELKNDYIIPQNKRIIIFEDIDAVGDILKNRKIKEKELKELEEKNKIFYNQELKTDYIVPSKKSKSSDNTIIASKTVNNNLSYFLNIIDGLNECSGRIIIMTTNRLDYLDPALIRPGRIDIKIEFLKCNLNDIYKMLQMFWKEKMTLKYEDLNNELDNKYTSAEIISIFRGTDDFNQIKNIFKKN